MPEKAPKNRVKIVGNAYVITSKLKFETIKKLQKHDDSALCLKEFTKDEEKELFKIAIGKSASISKCGIVFVEADKDGYATATLLFPESVKDKKEYIKENFAKALFMLNTVEARAQYACTQIEKAFTELDDIITEI
jgi:hypothetical protein